jgi:LPXTG-site transpeptidase (sortase) family protein
LIVTAEPEIDEGAPSVADDDPHKSAEGGADVAPTATMRADRREVGALRHITIVAMVVLTALGIGLMLQLTLISGLQHRSAQQAAFDRFRYELAQGTAPVASTDKTGRLLDLGAPVALVDIPSVHVHEIVGEGSTGSVLMDGPGHRRDTPLPGQAGTSVILGRVSAYGGPFKRLHELRVGAKINVTTGQGTSTFTVIRLRGAGDPAPPPLAANQGRLVLVTATGTAFVPSGVLRVDADLETKTMGTPTHTGLTTVPASEQPLGNDMSTAWALVLWLQVLVFGAIGIVWSWVRWGHYQTWIVFVPFSALVAFCAADEFMKVLPNLL